MFALFGTAALIFFLYVRPQEFIEVLQLVPFLYLFLGAAIFGLVLDVRLRIVRATFPPMFGIFVAFVAWAALTVAIKAPDRAIGTLTQFMIPMVLYFVISQSVQSFKALGSLAAAVLAINLFLVVVGVHQGYADKGCVVLDPGGTGDYAVMLPDGRPCDNRYQCDGFGAEPGAEYVCEKIGLFGTNAVSGRVRYRGILQDPNELAVAVCSSMAIAFVFFIRRKTLPRVLFLVATVVGVMLCTMLTQSRGGILVFMACLGVYGFRRYGAKFIGAGVMFALPLLLLGGRSGAEASQSSAERMEAWRTGVDLFKLDPIFGVGLGQFNEYHWLTAHNSYLLVASETGLLGMILWLGLIYYSLKIVLFGYLRHHRSADAKVSSDWALGLLAMMGATLIGILFLSLSYHPMLWIYLGLCAGYWQCVQTHDPAFRVRMSLADWALVSVACVGFVFALDVYLRLKGV